VVFEICEQGHRLSDTLVVILLIPIGDEENIHNYICLVIYRKL